MWLDSGSSGDFSIFRLLPMVFLGHDHCVDDDSDDYDDNDNDDDDGDGYEALWLLTNT